jgi:hypothetical protein
MHAAIKPTLAVLAATLWISVSEFFSKRIFTEKLLA